MRKEIIAENGAVIKIDCASFDNAMSLKNSIVKELASSGIDIKAFEFNSIAQMEINPELVSSVIKSVLFVDCSVSFNDALFKCMERCTYNKEKITKATFEEVEARENYYLVAFEVIKENISPFFKGAVSGIKAIMQTMKS